MARLSLLILVLSVCAFSCFTFDLVKIAHKEPVGDLTIEDNHDFLSFTAYGKLWRFSIWLNNVHSNNKMHYHGRLLGIEGKNMASFSFLPTKTRGMIFLENDTFVIDQDEASSSLFIYKASDEWLHPSIATLKCGSSHQTISHNDQHKNMAVRGDFLVAVYKDGAWGDENSNPWASDDEIYGLLSEVNAVYGASDLVGHAFEVKGGFDNPWSTQEALNNILTYFGQQTAGNIGDFTSNLLLVGHNLGGQGFVGICSSRINRAQKAAVAGLTTHSRLFTVKTIAHELGHNRGANHDFNNQCPDGEFDGCNCSVMSYCSIPDGATNYFSETSINEINRSCP